MRQDMLAHMPVRRLLWRLSVPAIMGMATMTLYNVVDTIYIGHGVGPSGHRGCDGRISDHDPAHGLRPDDRHRLCVRHFA